MLSTFSTITIAILATLIQPAPAPPVAAIGAIVSGAVAGGLGGLAVVDAATGGDGIANNKRRAIVLPINEQASFDENEKIGMRTVPFGGAPNDFTSCMASMMGRQNGMLMITAADKVVINGVPSTCMNVVRNYNAHPNVGKMNNIYGGQTSAMNGTAISITGIPDYMMEHLHEMINQD